MMVNRSLFLAAMMATSGWASATYTFTATNYTTVTNYTSCATGPCANYTTSKNISGSFTLASALPPNFSGATDISSQVTAYSFTDGVNTYANTNPNARLYQFNVNTDASGNITIGSLLVEVWQSGSSPHSVGNRVALLNLNGPSINQGENNLTCLAVGGGTSSGVTDLCQTATTDSGSSVAQGGTGSWAAGFSSGPTTVPTLGEWGMISLMGLLVWFAWLSLRRQERVPPIA